MDRTPQPLAAVTEVASELASLRREIDRLGSRVARLEAGATRPVAGPTVVHLAGAVEAAAPPAAADEASAFFESAAAGAVMRTGWLLLVLAGAFLLRAATEGGQLPSAIGVSVGLAYGLGWLAFARRSRRRGEETAAAFHAVATLLIAYPLLWEATVRFGVLGPRASAVAVAGVTAALLAAAWRQRLPALAWLVSAATFGAATALGLGTREQAPFAALLVAFAGASLVLAQQRGWMSLAWFAAAAADVAVAGITVGVLASGRPLPAAPALVVQLALLLLYLVAAALIGRRRELPWPLVLQCAAAVALGWGGALAVSGSLAVAPAVGLLGLLLALVAEGLALRALPAARRARAVFFAAALAFVLGGCALTLPAPALAWAALGAIACAAGALFGRPTITLQGALLVGAGALGTGALAAATRGLVLPPQEVAAWPSPALLGAVAAAACLAFAAARPIPGTRHSLATAILLALGAWLLAGWLAAAAAPAVGADAGLFAALGSVLLAGGAAVLARCGRGARLAAARWLVYPLLAGLAVKLLVVDLPRGRPFTLFLSLTALGAALLVAAARARRAGEAAPSNPARQGAV